MQQGKNDIWVFIETDLAGSALEVSLELLGQGKLLATRQGGQLVAAIVGNVTGTASAEAEAHGADIILLTEGPSHFATQPYTDILCMLLNDFSPSAMLIGATENGRDLAPRLACRLQTGLTADCTGLEYDAATRNILWIRPTLGGNLMATIVCPNRRPQLGTVRPGVFPKRTIADHMALILHHSVTFTEKSSWPRLIQAEAKNMRGGLCLEQAEIIVAGGKGMGGPEGFLLLQDLARALGGVVAASRGAVECGWISSAYQIGQTGATVSPRLYIACGISGAVQHLVGIAQAQTIVAINSDANAPILEMADYSVVGNCADILSAWIHRLGLAAR